MQMKRPLKQVLHVEISGDLEIIVYENPSGYVVDVYFLDGSNTKGEDFQTRQLNSRSKVKRLIAGLFLQYMNKKLKAETKEEPQYPELDIL